MKHALLIVLIAALALPLAANGPAQARPTPLPYKVLEPIRQDNLTILPVIAAGTHDTSYFITLDEGLRSGAVVVTESGSVRYRPTPVYDGGGAEVNRLVLVNNSSRPLLLLAGEIVTGGKQDRVVASDRIVPPKSDPVDLSVFCVEPGRWTGSTAKFGGFGAQMAQPSVRKRAMADRNQQQVWAEAAEARVSIGRMAAAAPPASGGLASARSDISATTSYAHVMANPAVQQTVDKVAQPIASSYESLMRRLRDRNAVGVVVAVNGRILWADIFASQDLLARYWPKLVRSYAAESITSAGYMHDTDLPSIADAQAFLAKLYGEREVSDTKPDLYRQTEITGPGYKVFRLTALLPKTGYDVHVAKMATETATAYTQEKEAPGRMVRRRY